MIKTNPQLASFSDEDLINEIIFRKYGASSPPEMQNLFDITKEEIKQIYYALIDKSCEDPDTNAEYAAVTTKFMKMTYSKNK